MKTLRRLFSRLLASPVPIVARPPVPDYIVRHQEAQDRGDFTPSWLRNL